MLEEKQINRNFKKLRNDLEEQEGITTISMATLRDNVGAGKLGIHVRNGISQRLAAEGISHYPEVLPEYQENYVRLYQQGTLVENLINAVLQIGEEHDIFIRETISASDSRILQRIRELVCD